MGKGRQITLNLLFGRHEPSLLRSENTESSSAECLWEDVEARALYIHIINPQLVFKQQMRIILYGWLKT